MIASITSYKQWQGMRFLFQRSQVQKVGSKVDSVFYSSEVNQMSTRGLSGKK